MAITYPRELPNYNLSECWMDYSENVVNATSGKGLFINATQIAKPTWRLNVTTGLLTISEFAVWSAWRKSLNGNKNFLAYDVRFAKPLAYLGANSPGNISSGWNGFASVLSVGTSGLLALGSLPAGYMFKAGDRVGLQQNGYYGYYELIDDASVNGSGQVTVEVKPLLHDRTFTTSAVARIWQPRAKFRLDWSTWSESGTVEPQPISFKGVQIL